MSVRSMAWFYLEPSFEEEFADPQGHKQLQREWSLVTSRRIFKPPFDVYETEQHIIVRVEIAGMHEEDFAISLEGQLLRISGTRGDSMDKLAYQRLEINYGEFQLDIRLPYMVSEAEVEASYDKGFLLVRVPRRPQQRRVPVIEVNGR